jgi:hypothetical protein
MNPYFYIKAFAWVALVGLACALASDFWLLWLIGAVLLTLLMKIALPNR